MKYNYRNIRQHEVNLHVGDRTYKIQPMGYLKSMFDDLEIKYPQILVNLTKMEAQAKGVKVEDLEPKIEQPKDEIIDEVTEVVEAQTPKEEKEDVSEVEKALTNLTKLSDTVEGRDREKEEAEKVADRQRHFDRERYTKLEQVPEELVNELKSKYVEEKWKYKKLQDYYNVSKSVVCSLAYNVKEGKI